jgi:hypothetical protein
VSSQVLSQKTVQGRLCPVWISETRPRAGLTNARETGRLTTIFFVALHTQHRHHRRMAIDPKYYGLIEMGFSFGVVGLFTVQQLWSLREKKPVKDKDTPPEA